MKLRTALAHAKILDGSKETAKGGGRCEALSRRTVVYRN